MSPFGFLCGLCVFFFALFAVKVFVFTWKSKNLTAKDAKKIRKDRKEAL
jgi:hypothetical protein